jgi:hypothetical protein|tara:strand:- start:900 stop:1358 length:459 start_codon:yes stop_codon:yes gene_type:complete
MATTAGDIYVRSGASGSFTSVQYVQGGWTTVPSASDMTGIYHDRLKDGQIIWVEHTEQLYVTRKFVAFSTPGYDGTDNSASFHTTNLGISGGGGSGIFATTGSVKSTTNNIEITGSLTLANGVLKLKEFATLPTAVAGGVAYSGSAFYVGVD